MQTLAAGELNEAFEIERIQALAHIARRRHHGGPIDALARIEIEHDAVADIEAIDHGAAHVDFEHAGLHQ